MTLESVLIVSSAEKTSDFLSDFIKESPFSFPRIVTAQSGSAARRALSQDDYDVILVNTPLSDEFGHELSMEAVREGDSGVILLVKAEIADEVASKVESYGVFVVEKPLSKAMLYQALRLVIAARQRIKGLHRENAKLHGKIEEMRLVDRAKCALIQYLGMTEAGAHRYIEKQAMDMRQTRREIAESILKTYET